MISVSGSQYATFAAIGNRRLHLELLGPLFDRLLDKFLEVQPASTVPQVRRARHVEIATSRHWLGALERYILKRERDAAEWVRIFSHVLLDASDILEVADVSVDTRGQISSGTVPLLLPVGLVGKPEEIQIWTSAQKIGASAQITEYMRFNRPIIVGNETLRWDIRLLRANPGELLDHIDTRQLGLHVVPWSEDVIEWRDEVLYPALKLLAAIAPTASEWIHGVVGTIILVDHEEGVERSGSWKDVPGAVFVSMQPDPVAIADVLIHEASHQYFHWMERVAPILHSGEHHMFYSEPVGRERPLDRILIAQHAFSNVMRFFALLREAGLYQNAYDGRIVRYTAFVDSLEGTLNANRPHLSAMGRSLFSPAPR